MDSTENLNTDTFSEAFRQEETMEDMVKMMSAVMEMMKRQEIAGERERRERETLERRERDQEMRASRCLQSVLTNKGRFDGRDVTKYLEEYKTQVEIQIVEEVVAIRKFVTVVETSLRESIQVLVDKSLEERTWKDFERRMKEEF